MKVLLFLFSIIICINCSDYILKAGTRTKGYCKENDYIFSFENSFFQNNKFPKQGNEFNLLMIDGSISVCKIKKKDIFLNKFDILCKIQNYYGCSKNINWENPQLENKEPEKLIFENGDILYFKGFSNKINIINENGIIKKELNKDKKYIFYIMNNKINKPINKNKEFKLNVKISNEKKMALCEIPKTDSINNFDIKCLINENISGEDKIEIIDNPEDDEFIFTGFKDIKNVKIIKKVTLEPGSILKDTNNTSQFIIMNNKFEEPTINSEEKENIIIMFKVKFNNEDEEIETKCSIDIDIESLNGKTLNIICPIPEDIDEIKTIYISSPPEENPIIHGTSYDIELDCTNFKDLTLYTLTLGKLFKGSYDNDTKIYSYKFINTEISKALLKNKWFYLFITINNEEKESICKIEGQKIKFNMTCTIQNYEPPDNYDLIFKKENYYNYDLLKPNSIYYNIPKDISTTTLTAGYIRKENCNNDIYYFSIINYKISGVQLEKIEGNFYLSLDHFKNNALCSIVHENNRIQCFLNINEEKDYCENINKDIKINNIEGEEYILIDNNILYLSGFKGLQTYTIEGGDIYKGHCDNEIYTFEIRNSIAYNKIPNEAIFTLKLNKPNDLNAKCVLPILENDEFDNIAFNLYCTITKGDSCPILDDKEDLIVVGYNPGDLLIDNSIRINFKKFAGKSTIITISAGIPSLDKNNEKYNLKFVDSSIDNSYFPFEIKSFDIIYELNGNENRAICFGKTQNEKIDISCEIDDIISNEINIENIQNPLDDYDSIPQKTIIFSNFENKKINTLIAGKIKGGNCNDVIYTFSFIDSKSRSQIITDKKFTLQMKYPDRNAICEIKPKSENEGYLYDIICTIMGTSQCPVQSNNAIIVGDEEPLPIQIDDNFVLYFSSFANQNTLIYEINVGPIMKLGKNGNECKYKFKFFNDPFNLEYFEKELTFTIDATFIDNDYKAICILSENQNENIIIDSKTKVYLTCYIELDDEICNSDEINYYDLKIGSDVDGNKITDDGSRELLLTGFNNQETTTVLAGNIEEKYIKDNKLVFILKNNNKTESLKKSDGFELEFRISEESDYLKAYCIINEDNNIKCEYSGESVSEDDDTIIKDNPKELQLNDKFIYFENFKDLRTYTIRDSLIQKIQCKENQKYQYSIYLQTVPKNIPEGKEFEMKVKIRNEDTELKKAICTINNSKTYFCIVESDYCPEDIIFTEENISPIIDSSSRYSIFFNDFKNKRTITVIAGKLNKGIYLENENKYSFKFTNNIFTSSNDKEITFNINVLIKENEKQAKCHFNLSDKDKLIFCDIEKYCPNEEDDLIITSNPSQNYVILFPDTVWYEKFIDCKTNTIVNDGMIIRGENIDNKLSFIITGNKLNENKAIENINFELKLSNGEKKANCNGSKLESEETFDILCETTDISDNEEIEIFENPINNDYYFYGYKNKKTLTLKAGYIKKDEDNKNITIINNNFIGDITDIQLDIDVEFDINYSDKETKTDPYNINKESIVDNTINIIFDIPEDVNSNFISILKNPETALLSSSDKTISLNYKGFKDLSLYTLTLGKILKGEYIANYYKFSFINTVISKSLTVAKSLTIPMSLNNELRNVVCSIPKVQTEFNMICTIKNYEPTGNYNIQVENKKIINTESLKPNTILIDISEDISTITLTSGYIVKGSCNNGLYQFGIYNNKINKDIKDLEGEFKLKLNRPEIEEVSCLFNQDNKVINCNFNISEDNKYCINIKKDIIIEKIVGNNYILNNGNILHLYGFDGMKSITVEAGDLNRGDCKDNIYEFTFAKSIVYNDILNENELQFPLQIKEYNNDIFLAYCYLPPNLTENDENDEVFNLICTVKGTDKCPIFPPDKDISIISNPGYRNINSIIINFINFNGKSTIIKVEAGKLSRLNFDKENKKYYIIFTDNIIDYKFNDDISFNLNYKLKEGEKEEEYTSNCNLNKDSKNIICIIENIESENVNLIISNNPQDDITSINKKTIIFQNFENKEIKTFEAGKIQKGVCVDKIYSFSFYNSNSQIKIEKDSIEFLLKMKYPEKEAVCTINIKDGTLSTDVNCKIEGASTCPVETDKDIIVGDIEPESIQIDENSILYFSSFAGQNTLAYKIHIDNLLKSKITEDCKYYFKFSNEPFVLDFFTKDISFSFDMLFNGESVTAKCLLIEDKNNNNEDNKNIISSCYFNLEEEICKSKEDLLTYDLEIGEDVTIIDDKVYNIIFDGLENQKIRTVVAGNIQNKYIENNKLILILENNKNLDVLTDDNSFDLRFIVQDKNQDSLIYDATCRSFEKKTIKCESTMEIKTENDIIINSNPNYLLLSKLSIYFEKFVNLRTFTIKAGQIQKFKCVEPKEYYQFNIINSLSESIPFETIFEIVIHTNNEESFPANCTMKPSSNKYSINCIINEQKCFQDIILNDDSIITNPNKDIFSPHLTFFNSFNNKRTVSIIAGKLQKGECLIDDENNKQYTFTFINNKYTYKENKDINFNLAVKLETNTSQINAKCYFNLAEEDNPITCNIDGICPNEDEDLLIITDPSPNYNVLYPNSLFYEGFANSNTITIVMKETGMIIKGDSNEAGLSFIITDNIENDNKDIDDLKDFEIQIKDNKKAICNIQTIELSELFNIECIANNLAINDEIEIIEEPTFNDYYFFGYKNKRTLTLKAGSIIKEDENNKFKIINNEFIGDITDLDFSDIVITFDIKYSDEIKETLCKIDSIINNNLNMSCEIPNDVIDSKTISIIDNPKPFLLNENITLNLINYKELILYTLTLGKLLKDKCNPNSFVYYIIDSNISKPLTDVIYFTLPIKINNEEKKSICKIKSDSLIFSMYCVISNYCPTDNIDIQIEKENYYYILNSITIQVEIPKDTSTTTLKVGYLTKNSCKNDLYIFTINGNTISGLKREINGQYKLKLVQFDNDASCTINPTNYISTCSLNISKEKEEEKNYCENINKDIKVEKIIGNNYILINDNYIHLYGFDTLETFTVEGGELNRGYCNANNKYEFNFTNSIIYNNLENKNEKTFILKLIKPEELDAACILSPDLTIDEIFNITCLIEKENSCSIILDKDLEVGDKNPNDILNDKKRVNFKNFTKKSTTITVSAGTLKLKKENNEYNLTFVNSTIDYSLDFDILFNIKYKLNNETQKTNCILLSNEKDINCELKDIESDDINIKILQNPNDNYDYLPSKTIIFTNFKDKEIYTFNAGKIKKGKCNDNIYTFKFINSKCQYNIENELEFYLKMKIPNRIAACKISKNITNPMLYDIECIIEGTTSCPLESDADDIIVGNNEPSEYKISDISYLYFSSFANQSTEFVNHSLYGGILTKKSFEKNDENILYKFSVSDCSINKTLGIEFNFKILISLNIYNLTSEVFTANCILESKISEFNKFDIECSFTAPSSYYPDDNNYDIKIEKVEKEYIINDEEILIIYNFDSLSTVTLYNCQILKGNCDSNNKYSYKFSSCILPQEISFENDLEFTLKIKNNEISKCKITSSNKNEIQCEIENSALCGDENDIEIGDNSPQIDYSKYIELKNFYISGLKNLYTSTLTGGLLHYGKCDSDSYDYIFSFTNTTLSKELLNETNFNLEIIEPEKMNSLCTIPKNTKNFTLNCIIKGGEKCPVSDEYSLLIKEITEEIQNDSIKPNTIYINNLKNRNIIIIKGGKITSGNCEETKYTFSFNDSEIIGDKDLFDKEISFNITLNYPETFALCNISKNSQDINKVNIDCYIEIEGNDLCPIFKYTYLQIGEQDPSENETVIFPSILKFTNFKGQKLLFDNYYISISNYENNKCSDDNYIFDLITTFNSDNIPSEETFTLTLKNENNDSFIAQCTFPNETTIDTIGNIKCIITDLIDCSLKLYFDYIFLDNKEKYIINLGENKEFVFNNIECPIIIIKDDTEIIPEKSESGLKFNITMKTSFTSEKIINIYNNDTLKKENILEYKFNHSKLPIINNFLMEIDNSELCKCIVPEKTKSELEFSCSIENISDTESDYFILEDTEDIIKVNNKEILLKGIEGLKIENIYKESGKEEEEESKPEPEPEEEEKETKPEPEPEEEEKETKPEPEPEEEEKETKPEPEPEEEEKEESRLVFFGLLHQRNEMVH